MFYTECHYTECHYTECHYTECHYTECHYIECHYAECRGRCLLSGLLIIVTAQCYNPFYALNNKLERLSLTKLATPVLAYFGQQLTQEEDEYKLLHLGREN